MAKKIIVRISPDASVQVEASGYSGPECQKATRDVEDALGVKSSDKPKGEMFQKAQVKNTQ